MDRLPDDVTAIDEGTFDAVSNHMHVSASPSGRARLLARRVIDLIKDSTPRRTRSSLAEEARATARLEAAVRERDTARIAAHSITGHHGMPQAHRAELVDPVVRWSMRTGA